MPKAKNGAESFTVSLTNERPTKRKLVFANPSDTKIGTLYLDKSAFQSEPKVISVTVTVIE